MCLKGKGGGARARSNSPGRDKGSFGGTKKAASSRSPKNPPGIVCYICGRKYGTTSFDIHVKQCAEMWDKQQKLKPKNE